MDDIVRNPIDYNLTDAAVAEKTAFSKRFIEEKIEALK